MKLKVAIGLIVSVVFIYLTFHTVDLKQVLYILAKAKENYLWLIPAIGLMLISHYLRALRWQLMLAPIKNIKINPLFSALMIGYAANNVFPFRAGEFLRAYALGKSEKISTSSAFATVFVERVVLDFIPLLVILSIIFVVFASVLDERIKFGAYIICVITAVVVFFIIYLLQKADATVEKLRKILPQRFFRLVEHSLPAFSKGCLFLKQSRHYFSISFLTIIVWLLYVFSIYFSFYIFDFPAKYNLNIYSSLLVLAFVTFGIIIPASPGYVGTFHYFCALSLQALLVPDDEAKSFALISHLLNVVPVSIIGLWYFWKENLSFSTAVSEKASAEHAEIPPVT